MKKDPRRLNSFAARILSRVVLPLGALAVVGIGSVTSASAAGPGTCPKLGCTLPVPIVNIQPQQLIINGGFENSSTGWGLDTGATVPTRMSPCRSPSFAPQT